jgi:uncharacterized membrane protein
VTNPPTTMLEHVNRRRFRRLVARAVARVALITALLLALYAVLPPADRHTAGAVLGLIGGLIAVAVVLFWQFRSILKSDHPGLRAAEALATVVVVLIVVFAFTYLSVWDSDHASFSEPLNRVGSIYFTVTTLGTVGYGDIVAVTQLARILVTLQIILDATVLVGVVRAVVYAARVSVAHQHAGRVPAERGEQP